MKEINVKNLIVNSLAEDILKKVGDETEYSDKENEFFDELANIKNAFKELKIEDIIDVPIPLETAKEMLENGGIVGFISMDWNLLVDMYDIDVLNDIAVETLTNNEYDLLDISYEPIGVIDGSIIFKVTAMDIYSHL